jgi:hypothetical protein
MILRRADDQTMSQACSADSTGSLVSRYQGSRPLRLSDDHQAEPALVLWVLHGQGEHAGAAVDPTMGIDIRSLASPHARLPPEPGASAIASVKDVADAAFPEPGGLAQECGLEATWLPRRLLLVSAPKAAWSPRGECHFCPAGSGFPTQSRAHSRGAPRPIEDPFAGAGQPTHPTGTHRTQALQLLAFRLFQPLRPCLSVSSSGVCLC